MINSTVGINIGPIFNCEESAMEALYDIPTETKCNQAFGSNKVKRLNAQVFKFKPGKRVVDIYHCQTLEVFKKCKESFFGFKEKTHHERPKLVSISECMQAVHSKITKYGRLIKKTRNLWANDMGHEYRCTWMKTKKFKYTKFVLIKYKAYVFGAESFIRQDLTESTCLLSDRFCRPIEEPESVIVWKIGKLKRQMYTLLGDYPVHRMGNYMLISQLSIGGTIIRESGSRMILDNTYLLFVNGNVSAQTIDNHISYHNISKQQNY